MLDDGESRRFLVTRLWLDTPRCTELFRQESVGRRVFFDFCGTIPPRFAHESCIKGCNLRERRSVQNPHLLSTMTDSAPMYIRTPSLSVRQS